jgi:hypothetical protein
MLYHFLTKWEILVLDKIFVIKTTAFWHMTTSPGYLLMFHTNLLPTTSIFISYTMKLGTTGSSETLLYLYKTTQYHILNASSPDSPCYENLTPSFKI